MNKEEMVAILRGEVLYKSVDEVREVLYEIARWIENASTVVRCKDCRHRGNSKCCPMMYPDNSPYYPDTDWTEDDGFCYKAERKNKGGNYAAD